MKKSVLFLMCFGVFLSCGRKNTFMSRSWHQMTSTFNVLYNGELAFQDGLNQLNSGYEEDLFEVLTVEPVLVQDSLLEKNALSQAAAASFYKAEEKAVKAIQKHSIQDYGVEQNSKMDEAYILLGKSRYYDGRFVPAQESFDYAIRNNPVASEIDEMRIWRAKSSIRLSNETQAVIRMKRLVEEEDLKDGILAQAETTLALAYEVYDSVEQMKIHLNRAYLAGGDPVQAARNHYILAQILLEQDSLDAAQNHFDFLAFDKKTPKKYQAASLLALSRFDLDSLSKEKYVERTEKLLGNQYYNSNFAILYYTQAVLLDSVALFQKSKLHPSCDFYLKQRAFNAMGDDAFEKGDMLLAGKYYDSILSENKDRNTLYLLQLSRKRANLEGLLAQERRISRADSIQQLWGMTEQEQRDYFEEYLNSLPSESIAISSNKNALNTAWYFSNPMVVAQGKKQFQTLWGGVDNADNWRVAKGGASKASVSDDEEDLNLVLQISQLQSQLLSQEVYGDSIQTDLQEALYLSSVQYFDVYNRPDQALIRLERIEDKDQVAVLYYLYLSYSELSMIAEADAVKEQMVSKYPDHKYTLAVLGAKSELVEGVSEEELYQKWYAEYESGCYDELIQFVDENLDELGDKQIILKFELLRSLSVLKMFGDEDGRKSIERFIENYPKSKEAEYAKQVLDKLK